MNTFASPGTRGSEQRKCIRWTTLTRPNVYNRGLAVRRERSRQTTHAVTSGQEHSISIRRTKASTCCRNPPPHPHQIIEPNVLPCHVQTMGGERECGSTYGVADAMACSFPAYVFPFVWSSPRVKNLCDQFTKLEYYCVRPFPRFHVPIE